MNRYHLAMARTVGWTVLCAMLAVAGGCRRDSRGARAGGGAASNPAAATRDAGARAVDLAQASLDAALAPDARDPFAAITVSVEELRAAGVDVNLWVDPDAEPLLGHWPDGGAVSAPRLGSGGQPSHTQVQQLALRLSGDDLSELQRKVLVRIVTTRLDDCYEKALAATPALAGTLEVDLRFAAPSSVTGLKLGGDLATALDGCAQRALAGSVVPVGQGKRGRLRMALQLAPAPAPTSATPAP